MGFGSALYAFSVPFILYINVSHNRTLIIILLNTNDKLFNLKYMFEYYRPDTHIKGLS